MPFAGWGPWVSHSEEWALPAPTPIKPGWADLASSRHRLAIQRFVQQGFKKAGAGGSGSGEAGFQLIAESHQGVDFGHDAVLFGEGGEWGR